MIFYDSVMEPILLRFLNRDRAKKYRPFSNFRFKDTHPTPNFSAKIINFCFF